jgi:hypothetical protein
MLDAAVVVFGLQAGQRLLRETLAVKGFWGMNNQCVRFLFWNGCTSHGRYAKDRSVYPFWGGEYRKGCGRINTRHPCPRQQGRNSRAPKR